MVQGKLSFESLELVVMPNQETPSFNFDAMLMFAWVADANFRVRSVNNSLRHWIQKCAKHNFISQIEQTEGIRIQNFFYSLLGDQDKDIGQIIEKHLGEIITLLRDNPNVIKGWKDHVTEGEYSILRVISPAPQDQSLLAAVRVVKAGGIQLDSADKRERVDLITVCQTSKTGDRWRVTAFQGQLQEAWLRVLPVIEQGTKSGTVGLMGRNLSHNIGSHALYWLEQDEKKETRRAFYRYLRERMELVAGFATSMPLSTVTSSLKDIIEGLRNNKMLLQSIGRSEKVKQVDICYEGEDHLISLPGGTVGKQAFYTVLENIIRDGAKYGRAGNILNIRVQATEPLEEEHKEDFFKITIYDDCKNYEEVHRDIEEALNQLRITDEAGRLAPKNWGIKERFICAAFLRGLRLENIYHTESEWEQDLQYLEIGKKAPGGLNILKVENVDGNLAWVLYLLKPKEILLVKDFAPVYKDVQNERGAVAVKSMDWLRENISLPSSIRHSFTYLCPGAEKDLIWLKQEQDKLPYRLFVRLSNGQQLHEFNSSTIDIESNSFDIDSFTTTDLYRKWIHALVEKKKIVMPAIVCADSFERSRLALDKPGTPLLFKWKQREVDLWKQEWAGVLDGRPVVFYDRHGTNHSWAERVRKDLSSSLLFYTPHNDSDPVRKIVGAEDIPSDSSDKLEELALILAEAALTKILIVDERLELVSEGRTYESRTTGLKCSYKELFEWKNIYLRGKEYGHESRIPEKGLLLGWLDGQVYDFVLVHRGVFDKIQRAHKVTMEDLCAEIKEHTNRIIVHSGRMNMADLPRGIKFLPLSNVVAWIDQNYAKAQIVNELYSLRRV
jgi:hypothetical protein